MAESLQPDARRNGTGDTSTLRRTLGPVQLMVLGMGAIIGSGIFVATGVVAATHTGPAIVISFLVAAAACLCAGLCYAEFSSMVPASGSAYSYVYVAFGRTAAWMIGWCLVLEYLMAGSTVAVGWSGYCSAFFSSLGAPLPAMFTSPPFALSRTGELVATGAVINAPAVILLTLLTLISLGGVKLSIQATSVLVAIKLAVLALFIFGGAFYVSSQNWSPFLPPNTGVFGEFGWSGVFRGAAIVFYAFLGFDAVSTAARETYNPQRTVPIGIIGSLALALVIYMAFSLVLTGLVPYPTLNVSSPASFALEHGAPKMLFLRAAVEMGAVLGLTSSLMVVLYALSRVLYAMAHDGLLPSIFGRVGRRTRAPYACITVCGLTASIAAGLFPVDALSQLISIGTLSAFIMVCAGVLALRITHPAMERPFRTPFAPVVSIAGIAICGYLMASLPGATWARFVVWLALGAGIYLFYGRHRVRPAEPSVAT
ncbi:amino acid permease [Phenylobacterium sp.]|uniref:amino acid permease n=1 Tax=Phenylobacterium sp. TaxID=1871053 RepID=UPI002FC8FCA0